MKIVKSCNFLKVYIPIRSLEGNFQKKLRYFIDYSLRTTTINRSCYYQEFVLCCSCCWRRKKRRSGMVPQRDKKMQKYVFLATLTVYIFPNGYSIIKEILPSVIGVVVKLFKTRSSDSGARGVSMWRCKVGQKSAKNTCFLQRYGLYLPKLIQYHQGNITRCYWECCEAISRTSNEFGSIVVPMWRCKVVQKMQKTRVFATLWIISVQVDTVSSWQYYQMLLGMLWSYFKNK